MEWIDFRKNPPKEYARVILFCPKAFITIFSGFIEDSYISMEFGDSYGCPDIKDVSHWMPLPEPPKH